MVRRQLNKSGRQEPKPALLRPLLALLRARADVHRRPARRGGIVVPVDDPQESRRCQDTTGLMQQHLGLFGMEDVEEKKAAAGKLTFENAVPDDLSCSADRNALAIVFVNLLENAAEYANDNGQIEFAARKADGIAEIEVTTPAANSPTNKSPTSSTASGERTRLERTQAFTSGLDWLSFTASSPRSAVQ